MSKFNICIEEFNVATQIAELLNRHNMLKTHYNPQKILNNNVKYIIEYGGYNERTRDGHRKVIGCVGLTTLLPEVTLIKHLCVDTFYRRKGVAKHLLISALRIVQSRYVQMNVRSDNLPSLYLAEKLGFIYISHTLNKDYGVLTLMLDLEGDSCKWKELTT